MTLPSSALWTKGATHLTIDRAIIWLMAVFLLLGALDRCLGGHFGLADGFSEGIAAMGTLCLSMLGIMCLAPVLARLLRPVLVPLYGLMGADAAIFAGTILANDMGGAALAMELAGTPEAGRFGGLILGSMLGATLVFILPVALGQLRPEERPALAKGILAGIVTIPLGALLGGLAAGFPIAFLLRNLVPVAAIALLLALGLYKWEHATIRAFLLFGRGVGILATAALALAAFQSLTGRTLLPGMLPFEEGLSVVGEIALILAGAFPLVGLLTRALRRPLTALGRRLGINAAAACGLVASLANVIAMLGFFKDMDNRGRVVNVAFAVSAAFVFGDHLGFTAAFDSAMLLPVLVAKLSGGLAAIPVALFLTRPHPETTTL